LPSADMIAGFEWMACSTFGPTCWPPDSVK
jgi:hypothetical protein